MRESIISVLNPPILQVLILLIFAMIVFGMDVFRYGGLKGYFVMCMKAVREDPVACIVACVGFVVAFLMMRYGLPLLMEAIDKQQQKRYFKKIRKLYGIDLKSYGVSFVVKENAKEKGNRYARYLLDADFGEMRLGDFYFYFDSGKDTYACVQALRQNGITMPPDTFEGCQNAFMEAYHLSTLPDDVVYVATKKAHEEAKERFGRCLIFKEHGYFSIGEFVVCTRDAESVSDCVGGLFDMVKKWCAELGEASQEEVISVFSAYAELENLQKSTT